MDSAELWIVRHGATDWSEAGRHTSTTDVSLTIQGDEQARSLLPRLAAVHFDLVLTSPRVRARRTAELAGFPDAVVDDDLAEWRYGDYEGRTTAEIREDVPDWTVWTRPCPDGESAAEVGQRLDRVVARAGAYDGRVLAFGHGHASRVLAARWLGLPAEDGRLFVLGTATLCSLGYEHGIATVIRWNA